MAKHVDEYVASLCLRRERSYIVERETAIDLILGLCEQNATHVSSDIGANDFLGVSSQTPGASRELSGPSS